MLKKYALFVTLVAFISIIFCIIACSFWFSWKDKALEFEASAKFWKEQHTLRDEVAKKYEIKIKDLDYKISYYDEKLREVEGDPDAKNWLETKIPDSINQSIPFGGL